MFGLEVPQNSYSSIPCAEIGISYKLHLEIDLAPSPENCEELGNVLP
jgi:hypothetical protein